MILCFVIVLVVLIGCVQQPLPTIVYLPSPTVQMSSNLGFESPEFRATEVEYTPTPLPVSITDTPQQTDETAEPLLLQTATIYPGSMAMSTTSPVSTLINNAPGSDIPAPSIHIIGPGPLSRVPSPFKLQAFFRPGDDGRLYIDLAGENNLKILQLSLNYSAWRGQTPDIYRDISFSIDSASEYAILTLSTKDQFGRLTAVSSVDLILLQMGDQLNNPASVTHEPYYIQTPRTTDKIMGGMVHVSGWIHPVNEQPVFFQLIDESNAILGTSILNVPPGGFGLDHQMFDLDIVYKIDDMTSVRLTIFQNLEGRITGIAALNSLELLLRP
jgi:hypothetical protein